MGWRVWGARGGGGVCVGGGALKDVSTPATERMFLISCWDDLPCVLAALQIINETLPTLCELRHEGTIRAIGITGYPLDIFTYILDR